MLKKALESINQLVLPRNIKIEILVIDNSSEFPSTSIIEEFTNKSRLKVHYFVEEKRGISAARNRLLIEALKFKASHIAMFDDDELLDPNWLISHFDCYNSNPEAIIISGPTYCEFDQEYPKYIIQNNIFRSSTTKKTGEKRNVCAAGNVFFPTTIMSESDIFLSENYNLMGGEDGDFFTKASNSGYTIIWNNEAKNKEYIDKSRANLKWIMGRYFYNGYAGCFFKFKDKKFSMKKLFYIIKTCFVLLFDIIILLPSLMFGLTMFFNVAGMISKTLGKITSALRNKPIYYYKQTTGC